MKYVYALFLMFVFCTSCRQKETESHKDNINYEIKDTVTSYGPNRMVRNVKQGRNGTILIAASFGGVFRYDGKSFTNLTSKIGPRRYWNILEDRRETFGSRLLIQVFITTMVNPFNILQPVRGSPIIQFFLFMKIEPALSGLALEVV